MLKVYYKFKELISDVFKNDQAFTGALDKVGYFCVLCLINVIYLGIFVKLHNVIVLGLYYWAQGLGMHRHQNPYPLKKHMEMSLLLRISIM